jgi:cystathionine beta-lyase/cystathionine gamma-synthase
MPPDPADDICPRPEKLPSMTTAPHAPPIYPASVWRCADPDEADRLMSGAMEGFVYQRDGHPNAQMLADKCCHLHEAECASLTASGMSALALALLSQTKPGDRIVISRHVYGKTLQLLEHEASRWSIRSELFDPTDEASVQERLREPARLVVVETISNPRLFVADIRRLAEQSHRIGALLLVDNTCATPVLCRPLTLGADLVMESVSKMMNGHSDVMLGLLCGRQELWADVPRVLSTWGLASSPWDCWLALRGIASLHLRMERASTNALAAAQLLSRHPAVASVDYPGLPQHPHHELAKRQLGGHFGSVVTFELKKGRAAADAFIRSTQNTIPFCPSLGEISTTLSHPQSTSHRAISAEQLGSLGISGGTIRLSCGIESPEYIQQAIRSALEV